MPDLLVEGERLAAIQERFGLSQNRRFRVSHRTGTFYSEDAWSLRLRPGAARRISGRIKLSLRGAALAK